MEICKALPVPTLRFYIICCQLLESQSLLFYYSALTNQRVFEKFRLMANRMPCGFFANKLAVVYLNPPEAQPIVVF